MKMSSEPVGAFVDAIYAIAVTILALEIPGTFGDGGGFAQFASVLVEYGVAFLILFSLWMQHRRINSMYSEHGRTSLWMTAVALLLVCLIPRATSLVFEHGGDVTFEIFGNVLSGEGDLPSSAWIDLFYVLVVLLSDACLWFLAKRAMALENASSAQALELWGSKKVTSLVMILVAVASFMIPVPNRYFLLVLPVALLFEDDLCRLFPRFVGASAA